MAVFQILIAIISAYILFLNTNVGCQNNWTLPVLGGALIVWSLALLKIGDGICANGKVLKQFGEKIGDTGLPDVSEKDYSITFWVTVLVLVSGMCAVVFGLLNWK